MNNLQFIATYIFEHPGKTRYNDIVKSLMLWKGFRAERLANIGGQYSTYVTKGYYVHWTGEQHRCWRSGGYKGILWEKIDKNNRNSGFKLTTKGMTYVVIGE